MMMSRSPSRLKGLVILVHSRTAHKKIRAARSDTGTRGCNDRYVSFIGKSGIVVAFFSRLLILIWRLRRKSAWRRANGRRPSSVLQIAVASSRRECRRRSPLVDDDQCRKAGDAVLGWQAARPDDISRLSVDPAPTGMRPRTPVKPHF